MASVIELFPRRPLRLRTDPKRTKRRILLLAVTALLALPALYWGYQSVHGAMLRADLKARGVRAAETMDAEGDCTSRRSRLSGDETPIDCWFDVTYEVGHRRVRHHRLRLADARRQHPEASLARLS